MTSDGATSPLRRQPRLGLALSGGTARTIAHVGVLKALEEAGVRVDCVAGTSGGSIVAALLAAGLGADAIGELACRLKWKDLATVTLPRLGFLSSQRIGAFIEEAIGDVRFADLALPCAIVATQLGSGAARVFTSGRVSLAVRASCSIPQIFSPCEVDGDLYIDGGIVEYLPVRALKELDPQVTLAVNLGAKRERARRPKHILQLIMQITTVVSRQNVARSEALASIVVRPDLSRFHPYALDQAAEMVAVGYDEMSRHMPDLISLLRRESTWLGRAYRRLAARP